MSEQAEHIQTTAPELASGSAVMDFIKHKVAPMALIGAIAPSLFPVGAGAAKESSKHHQSDQGTLVFKAGEGVYYGGNSVGTNTPEVSDTSTADQSATAANYGQQPHKKIYPDKSSSSAKTALTNMYKEYPDALSVNPYYAKKKVVAGIGSLAISIDKSTGIETAVWKHSDKKKAAIYTYLSNNSAMVIKPLIEKDGKGVFVIDPKKTDYGIASMTLMISKKRK